MRSIAIVTALVASSFFSTDVFPGEDHAVGLYKQLIAEKKSGRPRQWDDPASDDLNRHRFSRRRFLWSL